ncbi:carboxylesterase [Colletotrichum graminicola M1.001]|uniref:Carboxylesterase n=1 Tax=Colletotrichum graminicola (strain M1.001 / M2 / FGSC 10212) TaxID=645133 RepID=E3QWC7_COLGM|nr:carboxylesterase [Colletotrichum graminicola M1.001]EFQ35165.1 carboxylesterase [Colletotrichum graminicola M1.001]
MRVHSSLPNVLRVVVTASCVVAASPYSPRFWTVGQPVTTTSGRVDGHVASGADQVSEYLGIPYAQPPVGALRFQPPATYDASSSPINGSAFGHQCMQPASNSPISLETIMQLGIPASAADVTKVLEDTGSQSEDCLTLNVWTKPQTGDTKKAVLVWVHGGAFVTGSSRIPAYNGKFIADQEDVVVVSMNYRLNIFGFPGNPISAPNLGLLDIRMAMQWIRDNVEQFGGDAKRITMFGQSAGGSLVDYYSYAYASDPIANGFIPMSGVANGFGVFANETVSQKWFQISSIVGCGSASTNPKDVSDCMSKKNAAELIATLANTTSPVSAGLTFAPVVDEHLIFADYAIRDSAQAGYLIGNAENEAGLFKIGAPTVNETYWFGFNLVAYTCPAARRAARAVSAGHPTWRYRYFGDFPNMAVTTTPPSGAWHASELPVLFDTAPQTAVKSTEQEIAVGKYMRGAWAAFAKDTQSGLLNYNGQWPMYQINGATLNRISFENQTGTNLALGDSYDGYCAQLGFPIASAPSFLH